MSTNWRFFATFLSAVKIKFPTMETSLIYNNIIMQLHVINTLQQICECTHFLLLLVVLSEQHLFFVMNSRFSGQHQNIIVRCILSTQEGYPEDCSQTVDN